MVQCKCGYHTCKKFYKTETAKIQHLAGVKSAKKKNSGKTTTSKVKPGKGGRFECTCGYHTCKKFYKTERLLERHQAGVFAARTKKEHAKEQAKEQARDKPITPEPEQQPITKDEESPRKIAPVKSFMSQFLSTEATKVRIIQIENKKGAPNSQFVEFKGKKGGESNGIVDLLVVKKNNDPKKTKNMDCNVNDLLDIIHIQVKGGSAGDPTEAAKKRMLIVSKYYNCRETLLSKWNPKKFNEVKFYRLNPQNEWVIVDEKTIFG